MSRVSCGESIDIAADRDCGTINYRTGESDDGVLGCVRDAFHLGESARFRELRFDEEGGDLDITYVLTRAGDLVKVTGWERVCRTVDFLEEDGGLSLSVSDCSA